MAKTTTKAVIAAIERKTGDKGVELVKGSGYFYFVHPTHAFPECSSVMVYRLTELDVDRWVEEFESAMERSGHAFANARPATPAGMQKLVPQSADRLKWERDVTNAVALLCDCDNGDAQGIVEVQGDILESCWTARTDAQTTAAKIDEASAA